MKNLLLLLSIILSVSVSAQVGINTNNPNTGSVLDIDSTTKGVVFPKVPLTDETTWTLSGTKEKGMVVYNTNGNLIFGEGLYVWGGNSWIRFSEKNDSAGQNPTMYSKTIKLSKYTTTYPVTIPFSGYSATKIIISGAGGSPYPMSMDEYNLASQNGISSGKMVCQLISSLDANGTNSKMNNNLATTSFTYGGDCPTTSNGLYTLSQTGNKTLQIKLKNGDTTANRTYYVHITGY